MPWALVSPADPTNRAQNPFSLVFAGAFLKCGYTIPAHHVRCSREGGLVAKRLPYRAFSATAAWMILGFTGDRSVVSHIVV
jgi:hypothetical protein